MQNSNAKNLIEKEIKMLTKKIEGLKQNYREMCSSLAKDFEAEAARGTYYHSTFTSSYLRNGIALGKEIQVCEQALITFKYLLKDIEA